MAGYTAYSDKARPQLEAIAHAIKLNMLISLIVTREYEQKHGMQEHDSFGKFDHGDGRAQRSAGRG